MPLGCEKFPKGKKWAKNVKKPSNFPKRETLIAK
jgi:hypothetical protein